MSHADQPGAGFLHRLRLIQPAAAQADCPGEQRLRLLAVGLAEPSEAAELLNHAASCDACGCLLREAVEDLAPTETEEESAFSAGSRFASGAGRRKLARTLAASRTASGWLDWLRRHALRLAPAALLAGLIAWFTPPLLQHFSSLASAQRLTTRAYAATHRFPMRFPGVDYARVSVEMGRGSSDLSRPAEFFDAEANVKHGLDAHPDDPQWLHLQGRIDLLVGNDDAAIAELERAQSLRPKDPYLLSDLGAAQYQQAEKTQDPRLQAEAFESFSKAFALKASDPVLLFNKALAAERLYAFHEAEDAWQAYLKIDSRSGWAHEARVHLKAIQEKLQRQKDYAAATTSEALMAELRSGKPWEQLYAPDEEYLKLAVTHLLPAWYATPPDESAGRILHRMADKFIERHQDTWLRDVLRTPRSPLSIEAFRALSAAVTAVDFGQWDYEKEQGERAASLFRSIGGSAGTARAEFEQVQALHSLDKSCASQCQSLERELDASAYQWLRVQALIATTICQVRDMDFERAWRTRTMASQVATRFHYSALLLRALGMNGYWQTQIGNITPAWRQYMQGLTLYWGSRYPLLRGQHLYGDLSLLAPRAGADYSGVAWSRETVEITSSLGIQNYRVGAVHQLALAEMSVGMQRSAEAVFKQYYRLLTNLPLDTQQEQKLSMSLERAETETKMGLLAQARTHLEDVQELTERLRQAQWRLRFYADLGQVRLRLGDYFGSRSLLNRALEIAEKPHTKLPGDEGVIWKRSLGQTYRALVECDIRTGVPARQCWAKWSAYRAALADQDPLPNLAGDPVDPAEALLSFAELPSGIGVWLFTPGVLHFQWLNSQAPDAAARFVRHCAGPQSPQEMLLAEGRDLSRLLLGPWETELKGLRTLIIESDGRFSAIPWPALVLSNGRYWSEAFATRIRLGAGLLHEPRSIVATAQKVLAVGAPSVDSDQDLPPLPNARAEAESIAGMFPRSIQLLGREATLAQTRKHLETAEVFHFAGHGYGGNGGGLILRGGAGGPDLLTASDIEDLNLSKLRLAVLSGCSTGAGERSGPGDPQSLVRAFIHSHADQVLASFWNLNSAATEILMHQFYSAIFDRAPVEQCLRTAAAAVRDRPEYQHPYYWAGVQVFSLQ